MQDQPRSQALMPAGDVTFVRAARTTGDETDAMPLGLECRAVDEILKCDHPNESYWAIVSCGAVYYAVQGDSSFESVDEIVSVTIQMKAIVLYFPVVVFFVKIRWFQFSGQWIKS